MRFEQHGTHIALFSCYRDPDERATQLCRLVIKSKEPNGGTVQIPLLHNSVVVWSLDANRRHLHKIVLDAAGQGPPNEWLGVTFRTSHTFVQARGAGAFFEDGTPLTVADAAQRRQLYMLRGNENRCCGGRHALRGTIKCES